MNTFTLDELLARTRRTKTCWLWLGNRTTKGYGRCKLRKKSHYVHRVVLELTIGRRLRRGEQSNHRCDVRHCIRPDHLYLGSQKDNIADAIRQGRMSVQQPWFNQFRRKQGVDHPRAQLTEAKVRTMRRLRARGWTQQAIADRFDTSQVNVSWILNGHGWRHVK